MLRCNRVVILACLYFKGAYLTSSPNVAQWIAVAFGCDKSLHAEHASPAVWTPPYTVRCMPSKWKDSGEVFHCTERNFADSHDAKSTPPLRRTLEWGWVSPFGQIAQTVPGFRSGKRTFFFFFRHVISGELASTFSTSVSSLKYGTVQFEEQFSNML